MTKRDGGLSGMMLVALGMFGYGIYLWQPAACYCYSGIVLGYVCYKAVNYGQPRKPTL